MTVTMSFLDCFWFLHLGKNSLWWDFNFQSEQSPTFPPSATFIVNSHISSVSKGLFTPVTIWTFGNMKLLVMQLKSVLVALFLPADRTNDCLFLVNLLVNFNLPFQIKSFLANVTTVFLFAVVVIQDVFSEPTLRQKGSLAPWSFPARKWFKFFSILRFNFKFFLRQGYLKSVISVESYL